MSALTTPVPPQISLITLLNPFIRMFDTVATASWKAMIQSTRGKTPEAAFALEESDATYLLKAFLPGTSKDLVEVAIEDGELRLKARCEVRYTDGKAFSYVRQKTVDERFTLPADAMGEGLRTDFADGIFYVAIPRRMMVAAAVGA